VAESIDLTGGGKEFEEDQQAKNRMPPPAQLPPGVNAGTPPLPVGRAVRAINPERLTEAERSKLQAVGWKEGDPVPDNMADIIAHFEQTRAAEVQGALPLPADPATPPVDFKPVALEDLPPEQRGQAKAMVDEALASAAAQSAAARRQDAESRANIAQAGGTPVQMAATPPARPATSAVPDANHVPSATPAASPTPQSAPTPAASPEAAQTQETPPEAPQAAMSDPGSTATAYCPHCGWDMSAEDIPDPDEDDRISFLQSVLGQQSFQKQYNLLGGNMIVRFRTLTAQEIDVVYRQVYKEREAGELVTEMDYWERLNRYRLYLQIAFVQAGDKQRDLPDGLSKESNPHCTAVWTIPEGTDPLKAIEQWIMHNVLPSETLSRIVQNTCSQFNRVVAKLEARVEDADFWKGIGQQT
jgi:hypothetical protein